MAPRPADIQSASRATDKPTEESSGTWNTSSIILGVTFLVLLFAFIATLVWFIFRKRAARNKLPPGMRSTSYHPFRTQSHSSPDKSALLANAAPTASTDDESRKSSMFSRDRHTSVSLYVDTDMVDRRASMDMLIPLHITPAEEVRDPVGAEESNGSGASGTRKSRSYSVGTSGGLTAPVSAQGSVDAGDRPTRPRSTSTTSMRYYANASTSPDGTAAAPAIPKIVHTPSQ